jgi:hypothetical protein
LRKSKGTVDTKPVTTTPSVTLNQKGEITLSGKKVALESLRKDLQNELVKMPTIPNDIPLKTVGQTGMGMRAEVRTEITAAIKGAKWLRKKAALEAAKN